MICPKHTLFQKYKVGKNIVVIFRGKYIEFSSRIFIFVPFRRLNEKSKSIFIQSEWYCKET